MDAGPVDDMQQHPVDVQHTLRISCRTGGIQEHRRGIPGQIRTRAAALSLILAWLFIQAVLLSRPALLSPAYLLSRPALPSPACLLSRPALLSRSAPPLRPIHEDDFLSGKLKRLLFPEFFKCQDCLSPGILQHIRQAVLRIPGIKRDKNRACPKGRNRPEQDLLDIGYIDRDGVAGSDTQFGKRAGNGGTALLHLTVSDITARIRYRRLFGK